MALFTKLAADIYAPTDYAGRARGPSLYDAQVWGTEIEALVNAFVSTGGLIYSSLSSLNADLAKTANAMAWVIGDATAANNGIYRKVGASGAGSWTRVADLPYSLIVASNLGTGTPNAIRATTAIPVSESALVIVNVTTTNTSTPVTISFNGGSALTILSVSGANLVAGGLKAGMRLLGVKAGAYFLLLSDQAIASLVYEARDQAAASAAAAEAAEVSAEAARDIAEGYASDAVSQGSVPIYASRLGMSGLEVPAGISAANVNGEGAASDGRGGRFFEVASQPYHPAKFETANNRWFEKYSAESLSDKLHALITSGSIRINCIGTSLTYGYDTVTGGGLSPINGSSVARSPTPYPETLASALSEIVAAPTVRNYGYPGDTAVTGYNRWAGNMEPADVWFIEYSTNESVNYGAGEGVPHDYRRAMQQWIDYALSEGAVPVILGAPGLPSGTQGRKVRAFVDMARRVADENSVPFIDVEEMVRWMINRWTDGSHLTPGCYAEWGAHLAALFTLRSGKFIPHVASGSTFFPADELGIGGNRTAFASAESGSLHSIDAGASATFGAQVEEDCVPVITFYNASGYGNPRSAYIIYGNSTTDPSPQAMSFFAGPSTSIRRRIVGPLLRKGLRTFRVAPAGADGVFIEKIEFVSPDQAIGVTSAIVKKSHVLSSLLVPPRFASGFSAVDYSLPVRLGSSARQSRICADLLMPSGPMMGISLTKNRSQLITIGGIDQIMMLRSGTSLVIRVVEANTATDIATIAGVFAEGKVTATFEMAFNALGAVEFWVNGAIHHTLNSPHISQGYPAIHCFGVVTSGARSESLVVCEA